jgi:hypothetical protein
MLGRVAWQDPPDIYNDRRALKFRVKQANKITVGRFFDPEIQAASLF